MLMCGCGFECEPNIHGTKAQACDHTFSLILSIQTLVYDYMQVCVAFSHTLPSAPAAPPDRRRAAGASVVALRPWPAAGGAPRPPCRSLADTGTAESAVFWN